MSTELETIKRRIGMIEKFEEEIRVAKEAIKAALEDSPEYVALSEEAKKAASAKKLIRDQITNEPTNKKLTDDILINHEEINTLKEVLSAELMEYYKEQNVDEIEDEQGDLRKFKVMVKLLPKKSGGFR